MSEIGEQWSPQTAPAKQAATPITNNDSPPLIPENAGMIIGSNIPKVPQLVPVANEIKAAMINVITGNRLIHEPVTFDIISVTKTSAPSAFTINFKVSAKININNDGTIASKPLIIQSIASLNLTTLLIRRYTNVMHKEIIQPHGRASEASVFVNAAEIF